MVNANLHDVLVSHNERTKHV